MGITLQQEGRGFESCLWLPPTVQSHACRVGDFKLTVGVNVSVSLSSVHPASHNPEFMTLYQLSRRKLTI